MVNILQHMVVYNGQGRQHDVTNARAMQQTGRVSDSVTAEYSLPCHPTALLRYSLHGWQLRVGVFPPGRDLSAPSAPCDGVQIVRLQRLSMHMFDRKREGHLNADAL